MSDRSPHQGLPDEWNHGSHAAREPFSTAGASDGHGAGRTGSHRARTADGYGAGPAEAYGAAQADGFGARPDALGARSAGTYGAGAAHPFGDADPFRSRTGEPFEPATTAEFSAVTADAGTARTETERPAA